MAETTVVDIENIYRSTVEVVSGRETYIRDTLNTQPDIPYCTIWIREIDPLPHDVKEYVAPDCDTQILRGLSRLSIEIAVYSGNDFMQIANRIKAGFSADARIYDVFACTGKSEITNILDLSDGYLGNRQRRAQFNVLCYATLKETFSNDIFDKVEITRKVNGVEVQPSPFEVGFNLPPCENP